MPAQDLYKKITSFESLYKAYRNVRLSKRYFRVQQKYEFNLEKNLATLQRRLQNPSFYRPRAYHKFTIYEPKQRSISAPYFEDRIVHQSIFRVIEPLIVPYFIPTTYACIKQRGTHKAVEDLYATVSRLRGKDAFYLKADIQSYFASINHAILKRLVRRHIQCDKTLTILDIIIDSYEDKPGRGIPIGNLTSQLFANLYLNELDRFVISQEKEGNYPPFYFRYMDDFILLADDKEYLIQMRDKINSFLQTKLDIQLHPHKRLIQRLLFGIDFCGYNVFADRIVLRKRTVRRFVRRYKRKVKKIKRLERELSNYLLPEIAVELKSEIQSLKDELDKSTSAHIGFLLYSNLDASKKDYLYVNNIRLPYLPKSIQL